MQILDFKKTQEYFITDDTNDLNSVCTIALAIINDKIDLSAQAI